MSAEILAEVIRGETVESVHSGHICAVDGEGQEIVSVGDPATVTYFRSACKAFQFIPCITSGAANAFGFSPEEVALAVASHSGEPRHIEIAASMLAKAGFSESDLRCGAHLPFNEDEANRLIAAGEKPSQLHNNCSGKHAAMLAFAKHIDSGTTNYEFPSNRIQKRILRCVADLTGIPEDQISIGIDGCAAPNFALPLNAMARSFAALVRPDHLPDVVRAACARVVAAMVKFPELIGGTGRLDTILMQAAPGKIVSKVGADGVWLCGVLPSEPYPTGLGIALKIADGDDTRGRPVVAVQILKRLGILREDDVPDLSPMRIRNRRGDEVGHVRAVVEWSFTG